MYNKTKTSEILNPNITTIQPDNNMNETQEMEKTRINEFFKKQRQFNANKYCFDCNRSSPIWVSLTYSIFLCSECAGKHREFGVSISRLKSSIHDKWKLEDLRRVFVGTNVKAISCGFEKDYKRTAKRYKVMVDKMVGESLIEFPGDTFLFVEVKNEEFCDQTLKSVDFEVEEKSVPKIGSIYVEPIKQKEECNEKQDTQQEYKKKKDPKVVESNNKYKVKTNSFASLDTDHNKSYKVDCTFDSGRLGLARQSSSGNLDGITTNTENSKYNYKNIRSLQPRDYSEKKSIGKTAKKVAVDITEKGRLVINNILNKFKK